MIGAGPAGALEIGPQCLAGAVEPNHGVVGGEARLAGEIGRPASFEVDPAQDLAVFRTERREQRLEAAAESGLDLRRRLARG